MQSNTCKIAYITNHLNNISSSLLKYRHKKNEGFFFLYYMKFDENKEKKMNKTYPIK